MFYERGDMVLSFCMMLQMEQKNTGACTFNWRASEETKAPSTKLRIAPNANYQIILQLHAVSGAMASFLRRAQIGFNNFLHKTLPDYRELHNFVTSRQLQSLPFAYNDHVLSATNFFSMTLLST
jgi:hypothetical protein